jgi:hypothetical protein
MCAKDTLEENLSDVLGLSKTLEEYGNYSKPKDLANLCSNQQLLGGE